MPSRRNVMSYIVASAALSAGLVGAERAFAEAMPEFVGLDEWLNTDSPLTLAGLRGKW